MASSYGAFHAKCRIEAPHESSDHANGHSRGERLLLSLLFPATAGFSLGGKAWMPVIVDELKKIASLECMPESLRLRRRNVVEASGRVGCWKAAKAIGPHALSAISLFQPRSIIRSKRKYYRAGMQRKVNGLLCPGLVGQAYFFTGVLVISQSATSSCRCPGFGVPTSLVQVGFSVIEYASYRKL